MTSTKAEVDVGYSLSNDFFRLWLDERMHYTSAVYESATDSLEKAQENKARWLYNWAELDNTKTVLDIGCGWGANLEYVAKAGIKEAHGITLSTAQFEECLARKIPNTKFWMVDYKDWEPRLDNGEVGGKYDALQSIEMIDHLVSPAQARQGLAIDIYREYFRKLSTWVKPGGVFAFQAILRNRVPRTRKDLEDLAFTADIIFPGGLNPRLEELIAAVNPYWEVEQLVTRRTDYGRTTGEWLRRLQANEGTIRSQWGDQVYSDYVRYLSTCVKAFASHWSSDVQMKLRHIA